MGLLAVVILLDLVFDPAAATKYHFFDGEPYAMPPKKKGQPPSESGTETEQSSSVTGEVKKEQSVRGFLVKHGLTKGGTSAAAKAAKISGAEAPGAKSPATTPPSANTSAGAKPPPAKPPGRFTKPPDGTKAAGAKAPGAPPAKPPGGTKAAGAKAPGAPPGKKTPAKPPPSAEMPPPKKAKSAGGKSVLPDAKPPGAPPGAPAGQVVEPPPPKVSTSAQRAMQTAEADINSVNDLDPETHRKLWMQYLRSRQEGKAGGRTPKGGSQRSDKLPSELKDRVEANPNAYFELWVKSGRSWGEVVFKERQKTEWSQNSAGEKIWLWTKEVEDKLGKKTAEYVCLALEGTENYRIYPGCEAIHETLGKKEKRALEQWHILELDKTTATHASSGSRERDFTGNAEGMTAEEVNTLSDLSASVAEEGGGQAQKTPEEIAAEEEEKERKKQEAKAKALLPQNAVTSYLRNLPKDITAAKKASEEVDASANVPAEQKKEYKKVFNSQVNKLKECRDNMEETQAKQLYKDCGVILKEAQIRVLKLHKDLKEWKEVKKVFDQPAPAN